MCEDYDYPLTFLLQSQEMVMNMIGYVTSVSDDLHYYYYKLNIRSNIPLLLFNIFRKKCFINCPTFLYGGAPADHLEFIKKG